MEFIDPAVELIYDINPLEKIELAGRTCYKSESSITSDSALKFYNRLVEHSHTAMLEHATFVFLCTEEVYNSCVTQKFLNCTHERNRYLVSGNLRAINESGNIDLLLALFRENPAYVYHVPSSDLFSFIHYSGDNKNEYSCKVIDISSLDLSKNELVHVYMTLRITCDRGVSHEIVRHRLFSFAQESTRYVNYSKDKFGKGNLKFIKPANYSDMSKEDLAAFKLALSVAESSYNTLTEMGWTAQEARAVLPNAIKTEIVVTGNMPEWKHFLDLRFFNKTGAAHPDMQVIAKLVYPFYENMLSCFCENELTAELQKEQIEQQ